MKRYVWFLFAIFSWLALIAIAKVQAAEPIITTAPPKGFADLLEPQITLVDVYYLGKRMGSSMVSYTPQSLTLENPQEILDWLPAINDKQSILVILSQPLNTHAEKICRYDEQPDCGFIDTDSAAVIFDEANFRLELFINPALLPAQKLAVEKYLPAATASPSLINRMSLFASGQQDGEDNFNARIDSLAGWHNFRLRSNLEASNEQALQLDRFSLAYEYQNFGWQVGSFRNQFVHQSVLPQQDMLGFRVATSFNSRTDLEQLAGSRINLFLGERSRVEAYKDGRLIASRIYSAGNVELDTREFPDGAYNVELKITGDSGRIKTETQFFSKSMQIVPKGEHQFFFETGYFERQPQQEFLPEVERQLLFRTGYGARPANIWGYNLTLNSLPEQNLLEINNILLGNATELQSTLAFSDDGDFSSLYQLDLRLPEFFLSLNFRRNFTHNSAAEIALPSVSEFQQQNQFIVENSRQLSFSAGVPLAKGNLSFFARSSESDRLNKSESYGLSWQQNLFRQGRLLLDFNLDMAMENSEGRIFAGFEMRYSSSVWQASGGYRSGRQQSAGQYEQQYDINGQLGYRHFSQSYGQWNSTLRYNKNSHSMVADTVTGDGTSSLSWRNEMSNDYGYGRLELEQVDRSSSKQLGYALESRFNWVNTIGQSAFGGHQQNSAGVMIETGHYNNPDLYFAVLINGQQRALIQAGHSSFIALEPYQKYQLQLSARGAALVKFDDSIKSFSLYPGNVESFQFNVEDARVFIVQVVDQKLKPLSHAKAILNQGYARTDEQGWIQIELTSTQTLGFDYQGKTCTVAIDWQNHNDKVNFIDKAICKVNQ